jgi:hypothetical protein
LTIVPSPSQRIKAGENADFAAFRGSRGHSYDGPDAVVDQGGNNYQAWVGYLVSGLVEISQGTVDLQL